MVIFIFVASFIYFWQTIYAGCMEMLNGITTKNEKERIRQRMRKAMQHSFQSALDLAFPNGDVQVRVAIYIRTHHRSFTENAYSSLDFQERYYEQFLEQFPGFTLVRVYSDFPRPAGRPAFQRMLNDCKRGMIDLIIAKSMARFAPNMKECMDAVNMLTALQPPVGVFFEEENIFTLTNTAPFTEDNTACPDERMIWREPNAES